MKITNKHNFSDKYNVISKHAKEIEEITNEILNISFDKCVTKVSREKLKKGKLLFSPSIFNKEIGKIYNIGWEKPKVKVPGPRFFEMDGLKNKLGIEIQLGKYSFVAHDIMKMSKFYDCGIIDCGIEIVPNDSLAKRMSSGVASFSHAVSSTDHMRTKFDVPIYYFGFGL